MLIIININAQNPVAYWKMDETSGIILVDSSGKGIDATLNNSDVSTFVEGKLKGAIHFDGSRDAVAKSADSLKSTSITIATYVKADPSITGREWIAAHGDNVGNYSIDWDGGNMPSGIYFFIIKNGTKSITEKVILKR